MTVDDLRALLERLAKDGHGGSPVVLGLPDSPLHRVQYVELVSAISPIENWGVLLR